MTELCWQKSSFSSEASNCLELASTPDGKLRLRESDDPTTTLAVHPSGLRFLLVATRPEIATST
ncbi:DUF397 domain-containing protein [Streptomyces dioscori]|uniref:DUF397 domain-containing protein n=1 Tax=Streptomyces dioscori TaxID=2109333 RepID=A0A2P8QDE4_9ACTN|nr:DUF397 domain-containing protein [Streptomyces dioscori]PSM44253.1 DUF397 domain-containing protein [Streptomyces dioscori]